MAKNSNKKKEPGDDKRDGRLLEERSKIDGELDELMQDKLNTLGKIRDLVGSGGGLEKDIEAVSKEEDNIEGVISSIRSGMRDVTLEIKRLHEAALKRGSSGDSSGLRDIESKKIEVHKQKTKLLKDLVKKERELDKVSARKTKVLDEYSKVLGKRCNLEGKLDEIEGREIELKERKLDIESRIGKEIGDLTSEIYLIDSELEDVETKSLGDVMAARKKPPSTRDLLKTSAAGAKPVVKETGKTKPSEVDMKGVGGKTESSEMKPSGGVKEPEPAEMKVDGGVEEASKPEGAVEKPKTPEDETLKKPEVGAALENEEKGKDKGFLDFLGGGKGNKRSELPKGSIKLLQEILPVLDDLLGKLPDDKIEEFSTTDDYEKYNELFDKVSNYEGMGEQKEFINLNTKNILGVIDNLLENLPDEEIERFSSSDNFKDYNRLLDMFDV